MSYLSIRLFNEGISSHSWLLDGFQVRLSEKKQTAMHSCKTPSLNDGMDSGGVAWKPLLVETGGFLLCIAWLLTRADAQNER